LGAEPNQKNNNDVEEYQQNNKKINQSEEWKSKYQNI